MYVGVLLHVALLMESLAAELAWIRPRVRVYEQVRAKGARSLEGLAALLALEHLLRRVHGTVLRQANFVAKRLVAQFTGERPLTVMRSPGVDLQVLHIVYSRKHKRRLRPQVNINIIPRARVEC